MAQGSKPRHSRSTRKPVTIDLEPEAVKDEGKAAKDDKKSKTEAKPATEKKSAASSADKITEEAAKTLKAKSADEKAPEFTSSEKVKAEAERAAKAMAGAAAGTGDKKAQKSEAAKPAEPAKKAETPAGKADDKPKEPAGAKPSPKEDAGKAEPVQAASGGGFRSVAAGVAGGVIAIAVFAGLQWNGIIPVPGSSASGGLSDEINALKQSVASLESQAGSGSAAISKAVEDRIAALEKSVGSASGGGDGSSVTALEAQVSSLASKVEALGASGQNGGLADINDKLSALGNSQSEQRAALAKLQTSLTDLTGRISADEAKQDQSLQALDTRIASVEKSLEGPREDIKVARALAAASLKAAIDRGGAFMAELEAFASVDGDSPAIQQLRDLAASGVPSRATLLNEFPPVANAMINAATGSDPDSGWVDRLMHSAGSLVKVRPVGEVAGDSAQAIVARMEYKLNNGDLQGAVDEWKTLPEASRKVSQDYEKNLEARILVEKLVSGTVNAALPTEAATGSTQTTQTGGEN